jgi:hypothetical protein
MAPSRRRWYPIKHCACFSAIGIALIGCSTPIPIVSSDAPVRVLPTIHTPTASSTIRPNELALEVDRRLRSRLNEFQHVELAAGNSRATPAYEISIQLFRAGLHLGPRRTDDLGSAQSGSIELAAVLTVTTAGRPYAPVSVAIPVVQLEIWASVPSDPNFDVSRELRAAASKELVDRVIQLIGVAD